MTVATAPMTKPCYSPGSIFRQPYPLHLQCMVQTLYHPYDLVHGLPCCSPRPKSWKATNRFVKPANWQIFMVIQVKKKCLSQGHCCAAPRPGQLQYFNSHCGCERWHELCPELIEGNPVLHPITKMLETNPSVASESPDQILQVELERFHASM